MVSPVNVQKHVFLCEL